MTATRKIAHRAGFLQSFHTTVPETTRQARIESPGPEEAQALSFVKPAPALPVPKRLPGTTMVEVRGWKVLTGPGLITEPQAKYAISIAGRPSVTDAMRESLRTRLEQGFAKYAASQFISTYKDLPTAAPESTASQDDALAHRLIAVSGEVEAGRYALKTADGITKFYRVSKGKDGSRWAGRTFVEAQASDDTYPIRKPSERERILSEIAANPKEAAQRYGQELGKCSACGRTLTDETSRELGIGPDCRSK